MDEWNVGSLDGCELVIRLRCATPRQVPASLRYAATGSGFAATRWEMVSDESSVIAKESRLLRDDCGDLTKLCAMGKNNVTPTGFLFLGGGSVSKII